MAVERSHYVDVRPVTTEGGQDPGRIHLVSPMPCRQRLYLGPILILLEGLPHNILQR
jgi:hypothetical protein